jgi:hypothetical protein
VLALFRDLLNEETEVLRYSQEKMPPHAEVLLGLFEKCKKEGSLREISAHQFIPLFFGAIAQPILMSEMMERSGRKNQWFDLDFVMSKQAIEERVEIVLRGMRRA